MLFTNLRRISAMVANRRAVEARDMARLMGYLGALR